MNNDLISKFRNNLNGVIRGKEKQIELTLMALLSESHILIIDVPGTGKTTLAKAVAKSIDGIFQRVQFTPDLLPSDIIGSLIYNSKNADFHFKQGPIFANILLADEINRASPRTQSALLEAMEENQVTSDTKRHLLPSPFLVIATQNPIEFQGTYPLPEAQLDRFGIQLELGYPNVDEEYQIVLDQKNDHPINSVKPIATQKEVMQLQQAVKKVHVDDSLGRYMVDIVQATRTEPRLQLGASPRTSLKLYRCSQAWASLQERDFVTPDDIKAIVLPVMKHRIIIDLKAKYSGIMQEDIILDILNKIKVPV